MKPPVESSPATMAGGKEENKKGLPERMLGVIAVLVAWIGVWSGLRTFLGALIRLMEVHPSDGKYTTLLKAIAYGCTVRLGVEVVLICWRVVHAIKKRRRRRCPA
jgi:hypothetical protein